MTNINSQKYTQSKYSRRYSPCHPLAKYAVSQIDTLELHAP